MTATATSELARTLPGRAYCDENVFVREREAIFAQTWQYVGHVEKVRNPGDYFVADVAGESLLVVRSVGGMLRAFFNVCAHRGARFASGEGCRKRFSCPYHAWTYDTEGRLVGATNADDVPGFRLQDYGLQSCRIEELHGLVFVNLDPGAVPLREDMAGLCERLVEYAPGLPELTFVHRTQAEVHGNWKIAVENYSECYHCAIVHKSFFAEGKVSAASYRIVPYGRWHEHLAQSGYEVRGDEGSAHAGEFGAWWMWPNFAVQTHPGYLVNVRQWVPLAVDSSRVTVDWFMPVDAATDEHRAEFREHAATVFQEDIPLIEAVQRGIESRAYKPGPLMVDRDKTGMSEHAVQAIQALWRNSMETNI